MIEIYCYVKLELLKLCGLAKTFEMVFALGEERPNLASPFSFTFHVSVCVVEFGLSLIT